MADIRVVSPQYIPPFNEFDKKYISCRGTCCHSKSLTTTIGVITFIISLIGLALYAWILDLINSRDDESKLFEYFDKNLKMAVIVFIVMFAFLLIACICLFIASCTENHYLVLPYLIVQSLQLPLSFIIFIRMMFVGIKDDFEHFEPSTMRLLVIYCASLPFQIWFFAVVRTCYMFYKDKKKYNKESVGRYTLSPVTTPLDQQVEDPYRAGYDQWCGRLLEMRS